jgi:hypothetical protein
MAQQALSMPEPFLHRIGDPTDYFRRPWPQFRDLSLDKKKNRRSNVFADGVVADFSICYMSQSNALFFLKEKKKYKYLDLNVVLQSESNIYFVCHHPLSECI